MILDQLDVYKIVQGGIECVNVLHFDDANVSQPVHLQCVVHFHS
jgi:hypothetical protein